MMRGRFAIASLRPMEREILSRLRDCHTDVINNANDMQHHERGEGSPFVDLACHVRDQAMDVRTPDAIFASLDELRLLACIAVAQRQNLRAGDSWVGEMREIFLECGQRLAASGLKLPHSTIMRASSLPVLVEHGGAPLPMESAGVQLISARARAMALVQSMAQARTSDFAAIGVSRQTLSQLCKSGLLMRDERGRYRGAPSPQ